MLPFAYLHDDLRLVGQLAMPAGPGPHPGLMVMHDGQGVSEFICSKARLLAEMGYVALATDMFGGGKRPATLEETTAIVMGLRNDEPLLRSRVVASFEAFRSLAAVDDSRIGAIGYCFGGQCVLELARSGADIKAAVSFHGTLGTRAPAGVGEVRAATLVLTGAQDPFAPQSDVDTFREEMTAAEAHWQVTVYSEAKHGFTDPAADKTAAVMRGVGYDPLADRLSWAQAVAFLDTTVRA